MKNLTFVLLFLPALFVVSCNDDDGPDTMFELVAPVIEQPTAISRTAFSVDWNPVEGADGYEFDVSESSDFASFVSPYQAVRENRSNTNVIDLNPSTTYYFRARTIIGDETSDNSNVITVTTEEELLPEPDTPLKSVADFNVGMAVRAGRLNGLHEQILIREYDQITSEFEMKMNIMYPSEGNFNFTQADATVDWAVANGLDVHGHALIWHAATPSWVENFSGTDAEFEVMVEDYIKTTVTRYKGKVKSWDVVNEAFEDNTGQLRNSVFRQRMGDGYIEKCYQWTREADPDVLIFYNDYNMVVDPTKRGAAINMVKDFLDRGVPVDGFGFQMHISHNGPSKELIASTSQEVVDMGILLHFSELDVRANPNNDLSMLTEERAISQQQKYKEVVEVYNAIPAENKFALTVWGLKDDETWLTSFWGHIDWPLMYNADFSFKKAHTGFLEGLE
ncbi:MAG: endo-1,4-beta-xylanase [Cyclobacteriaceae bacterium]